MKVAIDVSPLKTGHKFRGVGVYTEKLVEALYSIKVPNFSVQLVEEGRIPQDTGLVHYPYFDFFFLTLPLKKPKPTVITIHDVTPLVFPNKFPKGIRGWFKLHAQKFSLKSVTAVITDSQNSKKDIIEYLNFPKERIFVVPLAPGKEFKKLKIDPFDKLRINTEQNRSIENCKLKIKEKYQLPDKFVLYVGDVNWNKNVEGLIKAFHKLKVKSDPFGKAQAFGSEAAQARRGHPERSRMDEKLKVKEKALGLVFAGKAFADKDLPETRLILQLIKQLRLIDQTKILGYVPTKDLPAIYNLASVYCQPSFYEGFGLPVLEAMACGCPVVAANSSSLPEVCGEAAVMVDPSEIGEISEGLIRVIGDDKLRRSLIQKGFSQVKKFSWQRVAEETINVYQKALAEEQRGF